MKYCISLLLGLLLCFAAEAQTLTNEEIYANASNFAHRTIGKAVALQPVVLKSSHLHAYNLEGGGFVIASDDSRIRPILAYSTTGAIDANTLPVNVRDWLEEYDRQIEQLGGATLEELQHNYQPVKGMGKSVPDSVSPLLVTEWNQYRYGYNSMVPYDEMLASDSNMARFDGHPTVGCGALAMAQIMRYWQFPQHGVGSHSYTHEGEYDCWRYGTLNADFAATTYQYANMPAQLSDNSTAAEVEAVATLCYHCGVSANMMYNSDCSGSSSSTIAGCLNGLQRYFHYSADAVSAYKQSYSTATWIAMLKNDIGNLRPILYGGQSFRDDSEGTLEGGHAFVFDGYDNADFFHVNWGWNGSCNGYYSVDVLRPMTQYNFTSYQYCVLGLEPCYSAMPVFTMASDLDLNDNTYQMGEALSGTYSIANIGDTVGDIFFGVNVYSESGNYYGCIDGRHLHLEPGDTAFCRFYYNLNLPEGRYTALMQYSADTFYAGIPVDETMYFADPEKQFQIPFLVTGIPSPKNHADILVAARFAGQEEYSYNTYNLCRILMDESHNIVRAYTLDSFNIKTLTTNQLEGTRLSSYQAPHPIEYYLCDEEQQPTNGFTARQQQLIADIAAYIESVRFDEQPANLDLDHNGVVDNLTIMVPCPEVFRLSFHVDADSPITINGMPVGAVNIVPMSEEYSVIQSYRLARQELLSIGLPDLSHRQHYIDIHPCDQVDILDNGLMAPSPIILYKYLHIGYEPQRITSNGTYRVNALGLQEPSLCYIRSAIDTSQWYTFEYRNLMSTYGINQPMLCVGRWMNAMPVDPVQSGNAAFDFPGQPNHFWMFRPGSDSDTANGSNSLLTSPAITTFTPYTDPHPYLADGTRDMTFDISHVRYSPDGNYCEIDVSFLCIEDIADIPAPTFTAYPNPATDQVFLNGIPNGTPLRIYNTYGSLLLSTRYNGQSLDLTTLPGGIYHLATPDHTVKIVKL